MPLDKQKLLLHMQNGRQSTERIILTSLNTTIAKKKSDM